MKRFLLFFLAVMLSLPVFMRAQNNCTPPYNLSTIMHVPNWRNVNLSWEAPVDSTEQIIKWSTTYATRIGGGDGVALDFKGFARFETSDLVGLDNRVLSAVSFVPGELQSVCTYYIEIYQGGSVVISTTDTTINPGTLIYNQQIVSTLTTNTVNTVLLDSIIPINTTQELWIAIRCNTTTGHPLGASSNTVVPFKGDIIGMQTQSGQWGYDQLGNVGVPGYNWLIEGVIKDPDQVLSGYKLYRNQALQTTSPLLSPAYVDSLANGSYTYEVTALYANGCESPAITATVVMEDNPCENCNDSLIVGTGTTGSTYFPTNPFYSYSYTQQIYTSSEISAINGYIPCLAFQYIYSSPVGRDLKIYMGNTNKTTFSSSSDWISMDDLVLVYDGTVNFSNAMPNNWVNIPLTTPFEWDGSSNLVVAVLDETGSYTSSGDYFNVHSATAMSLYVYRDGTPYDPNGTLPSGTINNTRNNIRFMVGDPITCYMPTHMRVSDVSAQSATVRWNSNLQAAGYELVLVSDSDNFSDVTPITLTDTFYVFNMLSDRMGYKVYLRSSCGNGDNSSWQIRSFRTPCTAMNIFPYTENFEGVGVGTNAYPECWGKISNYSSYPYVKMAPDSSNALYFYATSSYYSTAVSQALDFSQTTNLMALTFKARPTSSSYGRMNVGYLTDPTDMNTFVLLKAIYPTDYASTADWTTFTIPLGMMTGTVYFAFNAPEGGTSYLYVDDVTVDEMTGCSNPSMLEVSHVAGTSAMISWNAAPYGVDSYVLEYMETGSYYIQHFEITGTNTMLTDLLPETQYTIWLFSNCPNGASDTLVKTFTTGCLAGGSIAIGNGTTTNYYLPLNNFYNYSYTQQIYLASEIGGARDIHGVMFEYYYSTAMSDKTNVNIYLGHTSQNAFTSTSNYVPLANLQLVYSGNLNCHQGWNTYLLDSVFHYNGTDNLVLAIDDNSGAYDGSSYTFLVHSAGANRSLYYYSDSTNPDPSNPTSGSTSSSYSSGNRSNVKFLSTCDSIVMCVAPNPYVVDVTDASITVAWAPGNNEDTWEIEWKMENNNSWTNVGTVSSSPYTIVVPQTDVNYQVRIRSLCDGTDTSAWALVDAHTTCYINTLPYVENFNQATGNGSSHKVPCWIKGTNYSTAYPYPSNSYSHSAPYSLYFYGTSSYYSYAASPRLANNIALDSLQIQFYALKTSTTYFIEVGFMSDPEDISTFEPIGQYNSTNTYTWDFVELNTQGYNGTGRHLAFRIPQWMTSYVYLDDITIDYLPHCAHVQNLQVSHITNQGATITWTDGDGEQDWGYVYGLADSVDLSQETPTQISINQLDLLGLMSNTAYDVFIYASCTDGFYSNPMKVTFTTSCDAIDSLPYTQNFDQVSGYTSTNAAVSNLPECWQGLSLGTSGSYTGYPIVYQSSSYAQSSPNSLRFYTYTNTTGVMGDQYAIMPLFDEIAYPINQLMLQFDARKYSTSYAYFTLVIGVMTDGTEVTSFVPVDTIQISSDSYGTYYATFQQFTGTGRIAMMAPVNTSVSYNAGYVDNVVLSMLPSCMFPSNFVSTGSTNTSVSLDWTSAGTESNWNVIYGNAGFDPENGGTLYATTTHPCTISNLTTGTMYDFYVQTDCGNGDVSQWIGPVTVMPGSYCMQPNNTESIIACGLHIYDDGGPLGQYSDGANSTLTLLPDVAGNCVTVSGTADLENSWDELYIYDGNSASGTLLLTVTGANQTIPATTSTQGALTIVFTSDGSVHSYDGFDLTVSCGTCSTPPTPPTPDPCYAPTNLTATNITTTSVVLDWNQSGTVNNWTVNYKEESSSQWSTITANTHPFTLTGLQPRTNYAAYVVANCADTISDASNTANFRTAGDGIADYELSTTLYPNPNNGQFIINNEQLKIKNVDVYDVYGKLLKSVEANVNTVELDVRELSAGMYFVRISTEKGVVTKNFVKK